MTRKTKSVKGETVDFDLFDIKQQISASPKTPDVQMRESYIDIKRRRASRKDVAQLKAEQEKNRARVRKALEEQAENVTKNTVDTPVEDTTVESTDNVPAQEIKEVTKKPEKRTVRKKK